MVGQIAVGAPLLVFLVSGGCASAVTPGGGDVPRDLDAGAAKDSDASLLGADASFATPLRCTRERD